MTLSERIDRRQDNPNIRPIVERRQPEPVKPVWIRRMQEKGLPVQDSTGRVLGRVA